MDPSATNINKLADFFTVSADYLLGRETRKMKDTPEP
jgi:hypothetical protein